MATPRTKPTVKPTDDAAPWKATQASYLAGRAVIDGVTHLAHEMERKWGCGRLRLLVDDDLRARFDSQRLKYETAVWHGDQEELSVECRRMKNAWVALDVEAEKRGARALSPDLWEITLPDGSVAVLARENASAGHAEAMGRRMAVYTLDEIGNLLHGFPMLVKAKAVFPGAEIMRVGPIRDPLDEVNGDDIPF